LANGPQSEIQWGTEGGEFLNGKLNQPNHISALGGNDRVYGGYDNDVIYGGAGKDTIDGFDGDDYLTGGTNNDVLYGNGGYDLLDGGSGNAQDTGIFYKGDLIGVVQDKNITNLNPNQVFISASKAL
jgi:Ca2+-binding RTX toxin-like protein